MSSATDWDCGMSACCIAVCTGNKWWHNAPCIIRPSEARTVKLLRSDKSQHSKWSDRPTVKKTDHFDNGTWSTC